jgi:hypothetical protein
VLDCAKIVTREGFTSLAKQTVNELKFVATSIFLKFSLLLLLNFLLLDVLGSVAISARRATEPRYLGVIMHRMQLTVM